ncbi:MAG: hypothetical protein ACRYGG_22730, partial [Janthinobacterium lividum]
HRGVWFYGLSLEFQPLVFATLLSTIAKFFRTASDKQGKLMFFRSDHRAYRSTSYNRTVDSPKCRGCEESQLLNEQFSTLRFLEIPFVCLFVCFPRKSADICLSRPIATLLL